MQEAANQIANQTDADTPSGELATKAPYVNPGQFQPGNTAAMKHGLRSVRVLAGMMPSQADAVATLGDRVAGIINDLGGPDAISTVAAGMAETHAKLEVVEGYLWENLQHLGPLTGKGKRRAALGAWVQIVDRLHRSGMALGLERRRRAPDLQDYLRQRTQAAQTAAQVDIEKHGDVDG